MALTYEVNFNSDRIYLLDGLHMFMGNNRWMDNRGLVHYM